MGISAYDNQRSMYPNTMYRPSYSEMSYQMPYSSSYGRSSPWYYRENMNSPYNSNSGYNNRYGNEYGGYSSYGGRSGYDVRGYNPLMSHVRDQSSWEEHSNYLSLINDKENFQANGCAWDGIQQRCADALGICRGGCRDFSPHTVPLRDCRCIPYGYAALMKMISGMKKTKKA